MHNVNTVYWQSTECTVNTVLIIHRMVIQNAYYWQSYRMHNVNTVLLAIIQNA